MKVEAGDNSMINLSVQQVLSLWAHGTVLRSLTGNGAGGALRGWSTMEGGGRRWSVFPVCCAQGGMVLVFSSLSGCLRACTVSRGIMCVCVCLLWGPRARAGSVGGVGWAGGVCPVSGIPGIPVLSCAKGMSVWDVLARFSVPIYHNNKMMAWDVCVYASEVRGTCA